MPESGGTAAAAVLLEYIVFGSAEAAAKDVLGDLLTSGLEDRERGASTAEDEAAGGFEENDEKTAPRIRFAFSLEASFPRSTRNLEC